MGQGGAQAARSPRCLSISCNVTVDGSGQDWRPAESFVGAVVVLVETAGSEVTEWAQAAVDHGETCV
jgi:hypothetical protein